MDQVLEIVKLILPAGIVFLTAFFLIKKFIEREESKITLEVKKKNVEKVLPLRLQAYERIVLFLERVSPNSLIMRVHKPGMSAKLLQADLSKAIRDEFEHNMAQQIYVSLSAWEMTKSAKEETIKLINISASQIADNATGLELSEKIFELASQLERLPTDIALDYVKKEAHKMF